MEERRDEDKWRKKDRSERVK